MRPDASAPADEPRPEARLGVVLQKTYRLDSVIGIGGMGAVYGGVHLHLGHQVAIKVLHPRIAEQRIAVERFRREAQIASQLGHPSLVSVLDFSATEDGAPYLVMELLDGETLQDRLRGGPLSLAETCALFEQLCDGLHAVHEAGVVHRDLKPENIFLLSESAEAPPNRGWTSQLRSPWALQAPPGQRVKILDFGISKFQPPRALHSELPPGVELTSGLDVLGTPSYLAPEQASGDAHEADRRADVFALGTILYECLTGHRAFDGPHPVAIMRAMLRQPAPRPSAAVPGLPAGIDEVVTRACAKDPKARYATAQELREALLCAATPALFAVPAASVDQNARTVTLPGRDLAQAAAVLFAEPASAGRQPASTASPTAPGEALAVSPEIEDDAAPSATTAPPLPLSAPLAEAAAPLLPPDLPPPPSWDSEGDTLFDAEVEALRAAAKKAYAAPAAAAPLSPITEEHEPMPLRGDPTRELTMTDGGTASPGETITRPPTDRPTALLDTVPIPPVGFSATSRWAPGHDPTTDVRPPPVPRRAEVPPRSARGAGGRSWVVTLSTAAVAVLLGVVVGMLVLKLMSRGGSPSLALERAQQLERQLGEGEQFAAEGRCAEALGVAQQVLRQDPFNERALTIQKTCHR